MQGVLIDTLLKKFLRAAGRPVVTGCVAAGLALAAGRAMQPELSDERRIAHVGQRDERLAHDVFNPATPVKWWQTGPEALAVERRNLAALARMGKDTFMHKDNRAAFGTMAVKVAEDIALATALSERDVEALRRDYLATPGVKAFKGDGFLGTVRDMEALELGGGRLQEMRGADDTLKDLAKKTQRDAQLKFFFCFWMAGAVGYVAGNIHASVRKIKDDERACRVAEWKEQVALCLAKQEKPVRYKNADVVPLRLKK